MDVHRSRFVPFPASAITAVAFSRSSDSGFSGPPPALKLAIGRTNGSIEIWNPLNGTWVQETILPGDGKSVDALVWTQDPDEQDADGQLVVGQQRLFSIAYSPAVTEWDLATGEVKRKSTGNFSEVWCIAAQPRWRPSKNTTEEPRSQDIVAGCGDGTLVLLSTQDNDLQFKRFLARVSGKKARCMCVTYQKPEVVVAGFADGMLRVFDSRNGSVLRSMSLGAGVPGRPKNALVWQVKCLPNNDIVSGDSNGEVRFWDGKTYALTQRLTGHEADCLDLVCSNDGKTVFSGSIDGRMAVYRQSVTENGRKSWSKGMHRRVHQGEVKAMASFDSKGMSVVVSGGSDVSPVVTPLRDFGRENQRALPSLPQEPQLTSAPRARLLVSWWDKTVSVWRISRQNALETLPDQPKSRKLVAKIALTTKDAIRSVTVSPDGRLLAASTSTEVKVFQLRKRMDSDSLAVRKIVVPEDLADAGARLVSFSPDGKWLAAVTPESEVQLVRLDAEPDRPKYLRILDKVVELDRQHRKVPSAVGFKGFDRTITRLTFAGDSAVLVASDLSGCIDSWVLEGHEDLTAPALDITKNDTDDGSSDAGSDSSSDDSDDEDSIAVFYGQHWADCPNGHLLPKLDSAPLVLSFRPSVQEPVANGNPGVHSTRHNPHAHAHTLPQGSYKLFILTARHQMYELDVMAGKLSDWSRKNPTAVLPEDFTKIKDRVVGAVWDASSTRERVWLYGSTWVFMLNVGRELGDGIVHSKRRRSLAQSDDLPAVKKIKNSGAGDKIDDPERSIGPSSIKRLVNGEAMDIDLEGTGRGSQDADAEEDDDVYGDLRLARLKSNEEDSTAVVSRSKGDRKWWSTFKYRPILGMAPLEDDGEHEAGDDRPFEVILVERPIVETTSGRKKQ